MEDIKKESENSLNEKINNFVNKLSLICKKENDKEFVKTYSDIFLNIGKRKNNKKLNPTEEEEEKLSLYQKIQIEREDKSYRIEQLKDLYLNNFIKNIQKIKTQTFSRDYELDFVEGEKIKDTMQELIFKENEKLNDFKGPKNQIIFQKIDFDYYPDFISKLYGQIDEWSCTFKSVKKYSKFNMDIMYNIILYLLIQQLQIAFNNVSMDDITSENGLESVTKQEATYTFSKFVIQTLDNFNEVEMKFDVPEEELDKMNNVKREELRKKAIKLEDDMRGMPIEYYYLKKGSSAFVDEIDSNEDILTSKEAIEKAQNDKRESLMAEGAKEIKDREGRDATQEELEEFADSYINDEIIDEYETLDQFNLVQPKEGMNVIDVGSDYGELPQGIENEGDGISSDYFVENDVGSEFTPLVM